MTLLRSSLLFLKGSLGGRALGTGVIRLSSVLVMLLLSFYLANVLGPTDYGRFSYAWSAATVLATIAVLGTDVVMMKELPVFAELRQTLLIDALLRWGVVQTTLLSLLLACLLSLVLSLEGIRAQVHLPPEFWIVILLIPLLALLKLVQGALQALGRSVQSQMPLFLFVPSFLLLFVLAIEYFAALSIVRAVWLLTGAAGISLLWGVWNLRSGVVVARAEAADTGAVGETHATWSSLSLALGLVGIAAVMNDQIGVLILGMNGESELAGIFDLQRKISLVVALGLMMVNVPLAPLLAKGLAGGGDMTELAHQVKLAVRFAFVVALFIALVLILSAEWFLSYAGYGEVEADVSLTILITGQLVNVAAGPVWLILNLSGHARTAANGLIMGSVVNATVSLGLFSLIGISGIALGTAFGLIVWNFYLLIQVKRKLRLDPTIF